MANWDNKYFTIGNCMSLSSFRRCGTTSVEITFSAYIGSSPAVAAMYKIFSRQRLAFSVKELDFNCYFRASLTIVRTPGIQNRSRLVITQF